MVFGICLSAVDIMTISLIPNQSAMNHAYVFPRGRSAVSPKARNAGHLTHTQMTSEYNGCIPDIFTD
jgi:hypothetical protein